MKKLVSVLLAAVLVFSLAGCSLFSKADEVKLGDYSHKDPSGLSYDTRTVLKNDSFGETLSEYASSDAYPSTVMCDESGNPIGMYDYDAATGLAKGWINVTTGEYTAYAEGEEVDLGLPDESKMVTIPGTVTLYFVVYSKDGTAVECDAYLMLSDASAKDTVLNTMSSTFGMPYTAESDTVLKYSIGDEQIAAECESMGLSGDSGYITYLQQSYGVRADSSENPYKPYAEHKDPTDIEYDEKVVLTGSGQAAVDSSESDCISSLSTFLYGKDGDMVAAYTYYECPSKEAADKLAESTNDEVRVSDTVLMVSYTGDVLNASIDSYISMSLLKDHSVAEYTRLIEETFLSTIYE